MKEGKASYFDDDNNNDDNDNNNNNNNNVYNSNGNVNNWEHKDHPTHRGSWQVSL